MWLEHSHDEREDHHIFLAGRIAFISGSSILAVGIIVQLLSGTLDIWLPIALGVMILSKTAALMYFRAKC